MSIPTINYIALNLNYRYVDSGYIVRYVNMAMRELRPFNYKYIIISTYKKDASVLEFKVIKAHCCSYMSPLHNNYSFVAIGFSVLMLRIISIRFIYMNTTRIVTQHHPINISLTPTI